MNKVFIDAPPEVVEAAREIARAMLNTLRNVLAEEFCDTDPETLSEFTQGICEMMTQHCAQSANRAQSDDPLYEDDGWGDIESDYDEGC